MANRTFSRVQALNHGVKIISGTIKAGPVIGTAPGENDGLNNATLSGLGYTPSRGAAGIIEVNLGGGLAGQGDDGSQVHPADPDLYMSVISAIGCGGPGLPSATSANFNSESVATDGKVTFKLMLENIVDPTLAWDAHDLSENEQFTFTIVLRNSSADSR